MVKTTPYVRLGEKVTDHLGPVNATMFLATGVLVPVMDFIRPYFPYMNHVASVVVMFFVVLFAMKLLRLPANRTIPTSIVLCAGVCAAVFSVGAVASARHAAQGGFLAATSDDTKALQSNVLRLEQQTGDIRTSLQRIESGKSDDPRVELKNIGVEWSQDGLFNSARIGDLRALELFLRGGMSIYTTHTENRGSVALYIVADSYPRMKEQLELLAKYGYGLNDPKTVQDKTGPTAPPNLYALAKEVRNEEAARILVSMGADTTVYAPWKARQPKAVVLPGAL